MLRRRLFTELSEFRGDPRPDVGSRFASELDNISSCSLARFSFTSLPREDRINTSRSNQIPNESQEVVSEPGSLVTGSDRRRSGGRSGTIRTQISR